MRYLVTLTFFFFNLGVFAQGVPNSLQAAIFYKVLAYDYSIQSKSGGDLTIAIVLDGETSGQKGTIRAGFDKIAGQSLNGKKIVVKIVTVSNADELDSKIASAGGDIIYVADGASDSIVERVIKLAEQKKLGTLCGSEDLAQKGLAIGLTLEGGKPKVVINLPAARAQGMKLSSKVLALAKVID